MNTDFGAVSGPEATLQTGLPLNSVSKLSVRSEYHL